MKYQKISVGEKTKQLYFSYSESNIASISHLELEHLLYPCWEEYIETELTEACQEKKTKKKKGYIELCKRSQIGNKYSVLHLLFQLKRNKCVFIKAHTM